MLAPSLFLSRCCVPSRVCPRVAVDHIATTATTTTTTTPTTARSDIYSVRDRRNWPKGLAFSIYEHLHDSMCTSIWRVAWLFVWLLLLFCFRRICWLQSRHLSSNITIIVANLCFKHTDALMMLSAAAAAAVEVGRVWGNETLLRR